MIEDKVYPYQYRYIFRNLPHQVQSKCTKNQNESESKHFKESIGKSIINKEGNVIKTYKYGEVEVGVATIQSLTNGFTHRSINGSGIQKLTQEI